MGFKLPKNMHISKECVRLGYLLFFCLIFLRVRSEEANLFSRKKVLVLKWSIDKRDVFLSSPDFEDLPTRILNGISVRDYVMQPQDYWKPG